MQTTHFTSLLELYISGELTGEERNELAEMLNNTANNDELEQFVQTVMANEEVQEAGTVQQKLAIFSRLQAQIKGQKEELNVKVTHRVPTLTRGRHFLKRGWVRYAAAAVVLFAIATTYLLLTKKENTQNAVAKIDVKAPATNRATITLANGKTVYLDSAGKGQLAMQDGVLLTKLADGKIAYAGNTTALQYNTVFNPKGSKAINIELPDHSQIWLNAGSSVTFPIAFIGDMRKVAMNGELYYEVAHDSKKPFIVQKGDMDVQVYGTHFNVKAYDNDPDVKVTLLEGSVSVTQNPAKDGTGAKRQMLKPGQQAIVKTNNIQLVEDADIEMAMAWKNGTTSFHSADIQTVLRELERWYDITTEVKGEQKTKSFFTEAPRTASLQDVLKSLFDNNNITYEYDSEKRKLTILE